MIKIAKCSAKALLPSLVFALAFPSYAQSTLPDVGLTTIDGFDTSSRNSSLSADGSRLIGFTGQSFTPSLWSQDTGVEGNFLGDLPPRFAGVADLRLSGDGDIVVGRLSTILDSGSVKFDHFHWNSQDGFTIVNLESVGFNFFRFEGLSSDGRYIAGSGGIDSDLLSPSPSGELMDFTAFNLPTLADQERFIEINGGDSIPFRYDAVEDEFLFIDVPDLELVQLNNGNFDRVSRTFYDAVGISNDGRTIAIDSETEANFPFSEEYFEAAWVWQEGIGLRQLPHFDFSTRPDLVTDVDPTLTPADLTANARAIDISGDGNVIVGVAFGEVDTTNEDTTTAALAVRWTDFTQAPELLWENGGAIATNIDGTTIGGVLLNLEEDFFLGGAVVWTETAGQQTVQEWLEDSGVTVGEAEYTAVTGVSDDGSIIVLTTDFDSDESSNVSTAIARRGNGGDDGDDDNGGGIITLNDELFQTLTGAFSAFSQIQQMPSLTLNGAHHRTLMDSALSPTGVYTWATGDYARYNELEGRQAQGEIGASYDFGIPNFRAGLGLGYSDIDQDLVFNGSNEIDGQFLVAEADYLLPQVPVTLSSLFYYGNWDADLDRRYINAGLIDISTGSTKIDSFAFRLRADWKAYKNEKITVTPRASFTWSQTDSDSFTETGGGFPVSYDAQSNYQRELRLGLDTDYKLSKKASLRGILEYFYTWDNSTSISGEIAGITPFSFAGSDLSGGSFRGGLELSYDLVENQRIYLSAFASTSDTSPTWQGALSYGIQF